MAFNVTAIIFKPWHHYLSAACATATCYDCDFVHKDKQFIH